MFDIGADLQRAYSDGYKCGRLEALAELKRYISEMADYNDKADRKTENSSEKTNNSTISKMEQVDKDINVRSKDEPQTCSVNGRPYDCGNCEYFRCTADEPQTERSE